MVVGNAFTLALPVSCFNPQWNIQLTLIFSERSAARCVVKDHACFNLAGNFWRWCGACCMEYYISVYSVWLLETSHGVFWKVNILGMY
jgi:hypothetical protein